MKRWLTALIISVTLAGGFGVLFGGTALADANGRAGCFGLEASSISPPGSSDEFPGGAAQAAHAVREAAAGLGVPPGAVFSSFARLHEGSHEACDEAFE